MYGTRYAAWLMGLMVLAGFSSARGQGYAGLTYDPNTPGRRGQAGMTFLAIGGSARGEAMGGAFNSIQGDPSAIFYNVGAMASVPRGFSGYFGRTNWLADMTLNHVALAYRTRSVAVGLTFVSMDYGRIIGTVIQIPPTDGYLVTGRIEPEAWAAGIFASMSLTDRFAFGVHVKYAVQDFGAYPYWIATGSTTGDYTYTAADLRVTAFTVDLGSQYNTGFHDIMITMAMQNFARPKKFVNGNFDLPLVYRIGVEADVIELVAGLPNANHALRLCVDAVDARDALLDAAIGLEYAANLSVLKPGSGVALRVGRRAGDAEGRLSFGGGVSTVIGGVKLVIDYSYSDYGPEFNAHQWGLSVLMP